MFAPYEQLGIKVCEAYIETIKGQPAEVRAELWRMFLQDLQAARQFWGKTGEIISEAGENIEELGQKVGGIFRPKPPK